jgi:hypothetical protein
VGAQRALSEDPGTLWRDTFAFLGASLRVNPAYAKVGPTVELQPLSIFNLRLGAEAVGYFGTQGYLQSYASPAGDDSARARALGPGRRALGGHALVEPQVRLALGPVVLRDRLSLEYWAMGVKPGDTVFYEGQVDTLVPARGWLVGNELDLLFVQHVGAATVCLGVRDVLTVPLYGGAGGSDNDVHRLGPLASYTFFDRGPEGGGFDRPTLSLTAEWYLQHRFRTGAEVSQGRPYVLLAFSFQSVLFSFQSVRRDRAVDALGQEGAAR